MSICEYPSMKQYFINVIKYLLLEQMLQTNLIVRTQNNAKCVMTLFKDSRQVELFRFYYIFCIFILAS